MPGIELHADFDRDGRITGSPVERSARLTRPGAVVVANLDRDQRVLPDSVGNGERPSPDYDLATAFSRDDEVVPLEIRVAPGALAAGDRLTVRCSGIMHTRVRLSDATGVIVPHRLGDPATYDVGAVPAGGVLPLTLQVRTIAGAAFGQLSNLELSFRDDGLEETHFTLTVLRESSGGTTTIEDTGEFSVAPFLLDDRISAATRLYIATVPENLPSVTDVRPIAAAAGVRLVEVPESVSRGDPWLQDQYQHAAVQGPTGFRSLVVHLPRLRHENSDATRVDNLEDFVASHFRSRDLGLYDGLWDRIVPVNAADGRVLRVPFRQFTEWVALAGRVLDVDAELLSYRYLVGGNMTITVNSDWVEALRGLPGRLAELREAAEQAASGAPQARQELLRGYVRAAEQRVAESLRDVSTSGSGAALVVRAPLAGQIVALPADTARRLFLRGDQMHSSSNYGGNLEGTPGFPGAPLGAVIVGNAPSETKGEFLDPDLLRLLVKQRKQPVIEVDTTWLEVGHVDEMLAVVPHRTSGFSVLHASSAAAMALLQRATLWYQSGLPIHHPDRELRRPSGVLPRLMTTGTHPVTRLFRGKGWLHVHQPSEYGTVGAYVETPGIFQRLVHELGDADAFNVHGIGILSGEGPDRRYAADITPAEVIWCERAADGASTNAAVDTTKLAASRSVLTSRLGVAVLPVPVLFDRVDDLELFDRDSRETPTTAFSPDTVNLEVVNGHLLAPKPYGPRMKVADAIEVVREVMAEMDGLGAARDRVGRRLVAERRMTTEQYWIHKFARTYVTSPSGIIRTSYRGMEDKEDVKAAFKDSFPGADDAELERRLIRPNARHFERDGRLRREFTKLVVADDMVDLFELFTAAVVDQLGVQLHFVDTWYYHLRDGQIHCGTNVVRRPRRGSRPNVWDAPDHTFQRAPARVPVSY